jgi:non-ribosomal peptide synthetase component E (peptide arylation enzyme)
MTSPARGGTHEIADGVPSDSSGAKEIGFTIPQAYNASRILFDNLSQGRGDRPALIGPAGTRSYAELCAEASRWGHGFRSLGLKRGDRILMSWTIRRPIRRRFSARFALASCRS